MKRLNQIAKTVYPPLNATCSLIVEGGALSQLFRPDTSEYSPDRSITPLTIRPVIRVQYPSGVFGDGIANSKLGSVVWKSGTEVISNGSDYVVDSSSTDSRGTLTVYKNIRQDDSLTLTFDGVVPDTRTNTSLKFTGQVILTCKSAAGEVVKVELNIPAVYVYNPLEDSVSNLAIKATTYLADNILPDSNVKYWWYRKLLTGELVLIDAGEDIEYVSGIGTSTLTLDKRYIGKNYSYRCMADYVKTGDVAPPSPSNRAAFFDFSIRRRLEKYELNVIGFGDVNPGQATIPASCSLYSQGRLIPNPTQYLSIRWLTQNYQGVEAQHNFGAVANIPTASLDLSRDVRFGADERDRGALKALTFGGLILSLGNKIITH